MALMVSVFLYHLLEREEIWDLPFFFPQKGYLFFPLDVYITNRMFSFDLTEKRFGPKVKTH